MLQSTSQYISSPEEYKAAVRGLWVMDSRGSLTTGSQLLSLQKFIKRSLWDFELNKRYQVEDILHEAIIRGSTNILSGKTIRNLPAWLRGTCKNIINEYNRFHQKLSTIEDCYLEAELAKQNKGYSTSEGIRLSGSSKLKAALQTLNPEETQILHKKYFENQSWESIQEYFTAEGKPISVVALRKRGERAKKKLHSYLKYSQYDSYEQNLL